MKIIEGILDTLISVFKWSISPVHTYHIDDAAVHPINKGRAITALQDTQIASITTEQLEIGNMITVIPAGVTVYIRHTSIQLTSGEVICYGG